MRNIIFKAWVKYVNNLRILVSITSGHTSTEKSFLLQKQFNKLTSPHFSSIIFTHANYKINPLNKTFTYNPQHLLLKLIKEI